MRDANGPLAFIVASAFSDQFLGRTVETSGLIALMAVFVGINVFRGWRLNKGMGQTAHRNKMVRTAAIWIFGLLAAGIAGGMIGLALIPPTSAPSLITFIGGYLSGSFAFACFRLWFAAPAKTRN